MMSQDIGIHLLSIKDWSAMMKSDAHYINNINTLIKKASNTSLLYCFSNLSVLFLFYN